MSSFDYLKAFVNERLTAAAEEIFGVLKKTMVDCEEEIDRQQRSLHDFWRPETTMDRQGTTFTHRHHTSLIYSF